MDFKEFLPLGSVVTLINGSKKIMIIGRFQCNEKSKKVFDYSAVLWPEGYIDQRHFYLFNHKDIDKVYSIGFQNDEEFLFHSVMKDEIDRIKLNNK